MVLSAEPVWGIRSVSWVTSGEFPWTKMSRKVGYTQGEGEIGKGERRLGGDPCKGAGLWSRSVPKSPGGMIYVAAVRVSLSVCRLT